MMDEDQNSAVDGEASGLLPRRKILILAVAGGVLVTLAIIAFVRFRPAPQVSNGPETQPVNLETNSPAPVTIPPPTPIRSLIDSDGDRLSDEEETSLGTNPRVSDTDQDGLYDYEEVKTWHTDPRATDSDGDGFRDGDEVQRGFNPAGPGEARNLNSARTNTNPTTQ